MDSNTDFVQYLINEINQEYQNWLGLVNGLTPKQSSSRPEGGWSVIDTLVHVTAWQENGVQIAQTQANPHAPYPDPQFGPSRVLNIPFESFNQKTFESHRDWTLKEALTWFEKINNDLRAALLALPKERLFPDPAKRIPYNWFWRPAIVHSREHRLDIEDRFKDAA